MDFIQKQHEILIEKTDFIQKQREKETTWER